MRAPKHCGIQGCQQLARPGQRCPAHKHRWGRGDKRTGTTQHKARRLRVLKRDGYQCQLRYPGCIGTATICDHIIALGLGGRDADDNCQAACQPCSNKKASAEGHIAQGHTSYHHTG
ncbi:HNH endonuclease [Mycolicibacterium sp. XJ1904]